MALIAMYRISPGIKILLSGRSTGVVDMSMAAVASSRRAAALALVSLVEVDTGRDACDGDIVITGPPDGANRWRRVVGRDEDQPRSVRRHATRPGDAHVSVRVARSRGESVRGHVRDDARHCVDRCADVTQPPLGL